MTFSVGSGLHIKELLWMQTVVLFAPPGLNCSFGIFALFSSLVKDSSLQYTMHEVCILKTAYCIIDSAASFSPGSY